MSLRSKGLQNVDTGYKGLGESDDENDESSDEDEKAPPLALKECVEVYDEFSWQMLIDGRLFPLKTAGYCVILRKVHI